MTTTFKPSDIIVATQTAQGMTKGTQYIVTDLKTNPTPFGTFVSYQLDNRIWVNNLHLLAQIVPTKPLRSPADLAEYADQFNRWCDEVQSILFNDFGIEIGNVSDELYEYDPQGNFDAFMSAMDFAVMINDEIK